MTEYKAIINGRRYNTETATEVCDVSTGGDVSTTDFKWHSTTLYRTKAGRFFVAGRGGPMSRWAKRVDNGYSGGAGIQPIDIDEAKRLVEAHGTQEDWIACFGEPEEG